jgi:hypothetical protein
MFFINEIFSFFTFNACESIPYDGPGISVSVLNKILLATFVFNKVFNVFFSYCI